MDSSGPLTDTGGKSRGRLRPSECRRRCARSLSSGCSRDDCASDSVLRFSINVRVCSQPHRTSSSTKCSGCARCSGACSGWMASVAQGARGCGWSKHESGPAWHALQLCSIEYVPPKPTSRERELPTCADASQRDVRQTAAVSRCVSELHGKKYRILEIYVFAAWKPVLTCRGGLQGQR